MVRFLPLTFLIAILSLFSLLWIVTGVDPTVARWYMFALFVALLFLFVFNFLGLALYLLRTRFYKRYSASWYFKTSFKMAFFVALFVSLAAILDVLHLVNTFNIVLAIAAITLFALWSYLGKKS